MKMLFVIAAPALLASCAVVGPNFQPPHANVSAHYAAVQSPQVIEAAFEHWWEIYRDDTLNSLMARGLAENLNVKVAQERIAEALAAYRAAGQGSQLSGSATAQANATSVNGNSVITSESASLGANYVFDLFGGNARSREQAKAGVGVAVYDAQTVRLAYQFDLTAAYIDARYFQSAIAITNRSIANRKKTLGLIKQRITGGAATVLEDAKANAELSVLQAELPAQHLGLDTSIARISALTSRSIAEVEKVLAKSNRRIPAPTTRVQPGIPADLLRNRPDILSAERTLAAQMAAVGVQEAQLYPSLSLGGSIRVSADNTLQVGPSLNIPVFGRGRLVANRDAAISRARQAELNWQIVIRDAISEVEQILTRRQSRIEEISSLRKALNDYKRLNKFTKDSFESGATTLTDLLDTDQNITQTDNRLALANRNYSISVAELAVATGRGARVGEERVPDVPTSE